MEKPARAGLRDPAPIVLAALFLLTLVPGLFAGLYADDWFQIRRRPLAEVMATFAGDWNGAVAGGFYRPLVRVSFAFDNAVFGLHAWGYHLTNGILFGGILLCIYMIGRMFLTLDARHAILLPLVFFALHPLKDEALYWVSGRTDLLASLFVLIAYGAALVSMNRDRMAWAAASLMFILLGLLTKELALAGCLIVPVQALLLGRRGRIRTLLCAGPIALGCIYVVFRSAILGGVGGYADYAEPYRAGELLRNLLNILSGLAFPWQAEGPATFLPLLALPGVGLVIALVFFVRCSRLATGALAAMLISVLPMIMLNVSPPDGERIFLLPLTFQTIALIALTPLVPLSRRHVVAIIASLIVMSLQPANVGIISQFIAANGQNARVMEQVAEILESSPDGTNLILPDAIPLQIERRILRPGDSMLMAAQTIWCQRDGATSSDGSNPSLPQFGLNLETPGKSIFLSPTLQPWMREAIVARYASTTKLTSLRLRRDGSIMEMPVENGVPVVTFREGVVAMQIGSSDLNVPLVRIVYPKAAKDLSASMMEFAGEWHWFHTGFMPDSKWVRIEATTAGESARMAWYIPLGESK